MGRRFCLNGTATKSADDSAKGAQHWLTLNAVGDMQYNFSRIFFRVTAGQHACEAQKPLSHAAIFKS
jgi:hypothetical protein